MDITDINLSALPTIEVVNPEDYIPVNREKESKQITFKNLSSYILSLIPTSDKNYPEAITLESLISAISNKIATLSVADISYNGEIHMEYGNLRSLLTYMLDSLDSLHNDGISSKNVSFTPDGDTPLHVTNESGGSKSVHYMLNYILNNYRYLKENISADLSDVDISMWDNIYKPNGSENKDIITVQQAITQIYDIIANQTKKLERLFYSNASSIEYINDDESKVIGSFEVTTRSTQILTIRLSNTIICDLPGILNIKVYKDNLVIQEFEDALTTGAHSVTPFTFISLPVQEEAYKIKIVAKYNKDIIDDDILLSAITPTNAFLCTLEGYDMEIIVGADGSIPFDSSGSQITTPITLNKVKLATVIKQANTNGITNIVFSKTNPNISGNATLVSDDPNDTYPGKAYAIEDTNTNTLYVYPEVNNNKMYAPEDCSTLFGNDTNTSCVFTDINLSNFDTSYMTDMSYMFVDCGKLTSLDVSNFNTSKVTTMNGTFAGCNVLTSLDVSNFDTSNVTDMSRMFGGCSKLTSLDVSNFNTSKATDMNYMFGGCNALTSLDVSNFDTSNVTNMNDMFSWTNKLTSLDLSNFNTRKVIDMNNMFFNCIALTSLNISSFDTSNVTDMSYMFGSCTYLTSLDLSNFNTSKVTDMDNMFYNCNALTSLNISSFDTSKVTDMSFMFYGCHKLTSLDLSNFNTSKVTDMHDMFDACIVLTSLDLSNFDTSKVTDMNNMFYICKKLTSIDVSNFNTSNVTDMGNMFGNCSALTSLNISNFDTSKVTNMNDMFDACNALTTLYVKDENTKTKLSETDSFPSTCNIVVGQPTNN